MVDLLGPVVGWELVRASRKPSFFFIRTVLAVIVATCFWLILGRFYHSFATNPSRMADFAESFLQTLANIQVTAILLLVPTYLAGAIAGDKENRTLDFLLATSVNSRDIVLGKLLARMLTVALPIGSTMVFLSLASLFGGIAITDVFALTLFSATTLFAWSTMAICVSVFCRNGREALAILFLLLVALGVLPMTMNAVIMHLRGWASVTNWLSALWEVILFAHPYSYFFWLGNGLVEPVFWGCAIHLIVGGVCLGLAILNLRPAYLRSLDQPSPNQTPSNSTSDVNTNREGKTQRVPLMTQGLAPRTNPVGKNPIAWKEWYFAPSSGCSTLLTLAFMFSVFLVFVLNVGGGLGAKALAPEVMAQLLKLGVFIGAHAVCLMVVTRAANSVTSERSAGTWASLLTTPLTEREIINGKFIGAMKSGVWMMIGIVAIQLLELMDQPYTILHLPIRLAVLAALLAFLAALGLDCSINGTSASGATTTAVFMVIMLNGPVQCLLAVPLALIAGPLSLFILGTIPSVALAMVVWQGDASLFMASEFFWLLGLSAIQILVYSFAAVWLLSTCVEKIGTRERIAQAIRRQRSAIVKKS